MHRTFTWLGITIVLAAAIGVGGAAWLPGGGAATATPPGTTVTDTRPVPTSPSRSSQPVRDQYGIAYGPEAASGPGSPAP